MNNADNREEPPRELMTKKQFRTAMLTIICCGMLWIAFNNLMPGNRKNPPPATAAPTPATVAVHHEYRTYPIMGTLAEVSFYGSQNLTAKAADAVYDCFREVEGVCNIFDPQSEISRLNRTAAQTPFVCSPLLWAVLSESRRAWKLSAGAFDITARPLMVMWGFYVKQKKELPSPAARQDTLADIGLEKVVFDDKARTVKFTRPGMSFDLGGIAKGFAVDIAVAAVKKLGVTCGVINLAGNIYCFPDVPPGKDAYRIGIRNPLDKNSSCGAIRVRDVAIATSGNYERYVTIGGRQYTHIMNVKTGLPVENMLSATVVTQRATDTDWLSTAVFINGDKFAAAMVKTVPGTSILIIRPGRTKPQLFRFGSIWNDVKL